jgi:hypothetical protein
MRYFFSKSLMLAFLVVTGVAMATEEAEYELVRQDGDFELRDYASQIVAETVVSGSFSRAGNRAFRPLFNYISGDNTVQTKIAMTAPVSQTSASQEIAMTSPVGQRASGDDWVISFMMPAEFTMDTIPTPTDPAVKLREIPPQRMAAIRYSGRWTQKRYQAHLEELRGWAEAQDLTATGDPVFARYNAPFTPWFMRRNEILLPVAE